MEIEVTKKDMVLLIYRMQREREKNLNMVDRVRLDTQIAAIVDTIDPTGECKKECEETNVIAKLYEEIYDAESRLSNLEWKVKDMKPYGKLAWWAVLASIASLVMALVAVVWG